MRGGGADAGVDRCRQWGEGRRRNMAAGHTVVSHDEWIAARQKLLVREKEFTRLRDQMSRDQRALPWELVAKDYVFDGPDGPERLPQLFAGRRQLIVYHFMFGPDWSAGCPHCSFWADNFDRIIIHLNARDVTMVAVSRAPYARLAAYQQRMGWGLRWYSSAGSDFNFDFQASFTADELAGKDGFYNFTRQDPGSSEKEGISVFYRDDASRVFHTYSTYARGIDAVNGAYQLLDLVPNGRDEAGRGPFWVRRHDEYEIGGPADKEPVAIRNAQRRQ
jgi:predicted dithiol-disulfide oxidoreductase (DUF899 family)